VNDSNTDTTQTDVPCVNNRCSILYLNDKSGIFTQVLCESGYYESYHFPPDIYS